MAKTTINNDDINEAKAALVESDEAQARDREQAREELLADMPRLRKPQHLRIRHQNRFLAIQLHLRPILIRLADEDGNVDIDLATADQDTVLEMLEGAALIDEFAESIAYDREAYVKWSQNKSSEHFWAIYALYSEAQGN